MTVAQAIVTWLANQFIDTPTARNAFAAGASHLRAWQCTVPGRGAFRRPQRTPTLPRPERTKHGFAAAAYAKAHLRRRFMFCTASAGPAPRTC